MPLARSASTHPRAPLRKHIYSVCVCALAAREGGLRPRVGRGPRAVRVSVYIYMVVCHYPTLSVRPSPCCTAAVLLMLLTMACSLYSWEVHHWDSRQGYSRGMTGAPQGITMNTNTYMFGVCTARSAGAHTRPRRE